MEPVFMILGQSAAVAAAIAIDRNRAIVQDVSYTDLEQKMKQEGVITTEPDLEEKRKHPRPGEPSHVLHTDFSAPRSSPR